MITTHLHSATPWKIDHKQSGHPGLCYIRRDLPAGYTTGVIAGPILLEEARFIVLAVNNHEALLAAAKEGAAGLREVITYLRRDGGYIGLAQDRLQLLEAAIAAAERRIAWSSF